VSLGYFLICTSGPLRSESSDEWPWTVPNAPAGHPGRPRRRLFRVPVKPREAMLGTILALAFLATPVPSPGERPAKVYRIGWLSTARYETTLRNCPLKGNSFWQTWIEGLKEHGYVQGENLVIECRHTEGRDERAPAFAADLVSLKPDLIVAGGTNQVRAVKRATSTIPIVMHSVIEPVRRGLVASLARPGGNVTGLSDTPGVAIYGKYLQLLKEAVPTASRVACLKYLLNPPSPDSVFAKEINTTIEREARTLGMTVQTYRVRAPEQLEDAFAAMTKAQAEALLVTPHPFFSNYVRRIADLAAQSRLPVIYPDRKYVEAGGLMSYAMDEHDLPRRLAAYVDRIFKGAKPGDLPVEQPSEFELVLNLKTAKALGLTIPRALLIQADEVIR
jgi:putative ABC transport system substrate-binding protein